MSNTEIATTNAAAVAVVGENSLTSQLAKFRSGETSIVSSIVGTDFDTRLKVADAVTTSEALDDGNIDKTINLTNFVIQAVEMVNEQTGVVEDQPRVILIDDEGVAYHAISKGLFSSLGNLTAILGEPASWPRPVPAYVTKQKAKVGKVMVLRMGAAPKK